MLLARLPFRQIIGPKMESFLWAQEVIRLPAPWFASGIPTCNQRSPTNGMSHGNSYFPIR